MTEQEQKAFEQMREVIIKHIEDAIKDHCSGSDLYMSALVAAGKIQALTAANAVQPQAQGEEFSTIQLGFGKVEVAEGWLEGAPALIFGKNGTGVIGGATEPNREHKQGETLAVVTFANVGSLDVVLAKLGKLRADKFPDAHPQATEPQAQGAAAPEAHHGK